MQTDLLRHQTFQRSKVAKITHLRTGHKASQNRKQYHKTENSRHESSIFSDILLVLYEKRLLEEHNMYLSRQKCRWSLFPNAGMTLTLTCEGRKSDSWRCLSSCKRNLKEYVCFHSTTASSSNLCWWLSSSADSDHKSSYLSRQTTFPSWCKKVTLMIKWTALAGSSRPTSFGTQTCT